MTTCENVASFAHHFKIKVCLLGGTELYKNEFQKELSNIRLPLKNKRNMGVNISKIDLTYNTNSRFDFSVWNIDCNQQWAFVRTTFYRGSIATIIFISELRVEQLQLYYNELRSSNPDTTIIFCIMLDKMSQEEITEVYFQSEDFKTILESNNIKIESISNASEILNQVCSSFIKKREEGIFNNECIINFIPSRSMPYTLEENDVCNDYFEPINTPRPNLNIKIDTQRLIDYLPNIGFIIDKANPEWLRIKDKKVGTFSIHLRNGHVYLIPKICENCHHKKCIKYKKAPYLVCIEAKTVGWSNIKGLEQPELLVLSKILALKSGVLPKTVLHQIKKINTCEKNK